MTGTAENVKLGYSGILVDMTKKSVYSWKDVDIDLAIWVDPTPLHKFLETHPDVEFFSQDGYGLTFVVERLRFSMGGNDEHYGTTAVDIVAAFPDTYNISVCDQIGHSGFGWRRVMWVWGCDTLLQQPEYTNKIDKYEFKYTPRVT